MNKTTQDSAAGPSIAEIMSGYKTKGATLQSSQRNKATHKEAVEETLTGFQKDMSEGSGTGFKAKKLKSVKGDKGKDTKEKSVGMKIVIRAIVLVSDGMDAKGVLQNSIKPGGECEGMLEEHKLAIFATESGKLWFCKEWSSLRINQWLRNPGEERHWCLLKASHNRLYKQRRTSMGLNLDAAKGNAGHPWSGPWSEFKLYFGQEKSDKENLQKLTWLGRVYKNNWDPFACKCDSESGHEDSEDIQNSAKFKTVQKDSFSAPGKKSLGKRKRVEKAVHLVFWMFGLIYTLEAKNSAKTQKDDEELFLPTTSDEEEELHTDLLAIRDRVSARVTQSQLPGLASTSSTVLESVGYEPILLNTNLTALGPTTLTEVNPRPEDLTTPLAVMPLPADIWTPTELTTSPPAQIGMYGFSSPTPSGRDFWSL
ncbi:hypothetical protein K439DRAFT_1545814 [Ramaria rubella]|nr:hypothetical protein K439DRAFT_1545814 [Ramaria rubella]